jgi:phasin
MTTETNPFLSSFQSAFAPVTDALKNVQGLEVPEAARDFVRRSAETAKERTVELQTGAEKVTGVIETAVSGSISEAIKVTRSIQQALFDDAHAFFAGLDKLAAAKSIPEAVQIQSDLLRSQGETAVARAKSASEYVGKLVTEGAKSAQDNFAQVVAATRKVA